MFKTRKFQQKFTEPNDETTARFVPFVLTAGGALSIPCAISYTLCDILYRSFSRLVEPSANPRLISSDRP